MHIYENPPFIQDNFEKVKICHLQKLNLYQGDKQL